MYFLDVLVGPKGYRNIGEVHQFVKLEHFSTTFITSDGFLPVRQDVLYKSANVRRLIPDFLSKTFVRKPYGPVSLVDFQELESVVTGDIVNSPELYSFSSRQCSSVSRNGIKFTISSWETLEANPLFYSLPYSFNVEWTSRRVHSVLVPDHRAAECLIRRGLPRKKVKVVHPGIDIRMFNPVKQDHDTFRILFVGRLDYEKGINLLLRAFVELYFIYDKVELWLCGPIRSGGSLVREIQKLSSKYPIHLLGEVPHDSLMEVYGKCDLFCLPSIDRWKWGFKVWEEQFGWTLVEAMASGLPIVASNCGAIKEVIGEENLIVAQNSYEELRTAISRLIANKALCQSLSEKNRARACLLFDLDKQRLAMDKTLLEIVES